LNEFACPQCEQSCTHVHRHPLLEIHQQILTACVQQGDGDRDNSVVIEEVRRRTAKR